MTAKIQSVMKWEIWSNENRMPLNMEKTYEMIVRAKMSTSLPEYIPSNKTERMAQIIRCYDGRNTRKMG